MTDFGRLAIVMLAGALAAAAAMLLAGAYAPLRWRCHAGWSWAIASGIYAACGIAGEWPHWPPLEDRARFLTILLPLTLVVETVAAFVRSSTVAWTMRLSLAAVAAPILLYNSAYLVDLSGPGTAHWLPMQSATVLCFLAALPAIVWWLLDALQSRTSARVVESVLALDALAAALTVMLSGYFRGGQLGLALASAIAGAALASCFVKPQSSTSGSLGMSVIGIFTVVLIGRFFGSLSTGLAMVLLLTPLLAWTVELPKLRTLPVAWRTAVRLLCVAVPLLVVVLIAQARFTEASAARSKTR